MGGPSVHLDIAQARRLALGAQGFARSRPTGRVDRRHLRRALDDMGLIQIDSVNVLVRSQELPLFARLGPHPHDLIPAATADGELFEYWVHEASHVPTAHHHLHRWKMGTPHRWGGIRQVVRRRPDLVDTVLNRITEEGPLTAGDLQQRRGPKGPWWDWDDAKAVLEHLFWEGRLTATRRDRDFARLYDLPDRALPREVLERRTPEEADARAELVALAARSLGVATLSDLADYHRQRQIDCKPVVRRLVEEGRLNEVEVEGWSEVAYLHPDASIPRRIDTCALLSPFDPVVWNRDRAERLFGFRYRIEIYTPAPKRIFGYYVLPVLVDDRLVGRLDLKADRASGTLRVLSAHAEAEGLAERSAGRIAAELTSMAGWLGLERVDVADRGALSEPLRRAGRSAAPT
jgi:uncharacterized protein YcaQ